MKTKYLLLIMLSLLIISGCSKTETIKPSNTTTANQRNPGAQAQNNQRLRMPQEAPAFTGKIKEIIGNEITYIKAQEDNSSVAQTTPDSTSSSEPQSKNYTFTEETFTFLIPVGTSIISRPGTEVTLSELKKEAIIHVWKTDDNVTLVQLLTTNDRTPQSRNSRNTNGTENNMPGAGTGFGARPMGGM